MIHCNSWEDDPCKLNNFLCLNNNRIWGKVLSPPDGFGCCPFQGGGSVVDLLFIVASIVGLCVKLCSMFCCAIFCVLSSFAIILMGKRELALPVTVIVLWLFLTILTYFFKLPVHAIVLGFFLKT